jgi:hypothetical protein
MKTVIVRLVGGFLLLEVLSVEAQFLVTARHHLRSIVDVLVQDVLLQ